MLQGLFTKKELRCPFCNANLMNNSTKCTECGAVKDFTRYNHLAVLLFGFCGSLVFPAILYFFAQLSDNLSPSTAISDNDANVSFAIVLFLSLVCILFLIAKLPYFKGKWVRAT